MEIIIQLFFCLLMLLSLIGSALGVWALFKTVKRM